MPRSPFGQRVVFLHGQTLLPELDMIGWDRFRRAVPGHLGPHTHRGCFELCLIRSGTVDWWAGGEVWEVTAGQLYVTFPGEAHGGVGTVMNPCELYWLQVHVPERGRLPGLSAAETATLHARLAALRPRCFDASDAVEPHFAALLREHVGRDEFSVPTARAALHQLLAAVVRDNAAARTAHADRTSEAVAHALRLIARDSRYEVATLADAVWLSGSQFRHRFGREVGVAPAQFLLRRRIRAAKHALRTGQRVTDLAMRLGFSSSQHFATMFRRQAGMTPRQYARLTAGDEPTAP